MIIGILSDTHGHVERTRTAVELLIEHGAERLFHCGDLGSEAVLDCMAAAWPHVRPPVVCVTGNVDIWNVDLLRYPESSGVIVAGRFHEETIGGRKIAVLHGDDASRFQDLIEQGAHDYLFTGHTHVRADDLAGGLRIINPGAVYRAATPSVATLEPENGRLVFYSLDGRRLGAES